MASKIVGLNPRLITDNIELVDGIYLASCHLRKTTVFCPNCGKKTRSIHSIYYSKFYDLPIQEIPVLIKLERKKCICRKKCSIKTFIENVDFISPKGRKTKRLIKTIVNLNKDMSSIQASKDLYDMGIIAKKSSICNYLKKTKIIVTNSNDVTSIAIDDFATKRRYKYVSLAGARFYVLNESDKTSNLILDKLDEANINYCFMDSFAQGEVQDFKNNVLLRNLQSKLNDFNQTKNFVTLNPKELVDIIFQECHIQGSHYQLEAEKKVFYDKYIKKGFKVSIVGEGDEQRFMMELASVK